MEFREFRVHAEVVQDFLHALTSGQQGMKEWNPLAIPLYLGYCPHPVTVYMRGLIKGYQGLYITVL